MPGRAPETREALIAWVLRRVDKMPDGCWLHRGSQNGRGYARIVIHGHLQVTHRVVYELLVGQVPEGLSLDHLCRVRHCVNPAHLEPVTHRENCLRGVGVGARNAAKTRCRKGHPFTAIRIRSRGAERVCMVCVRAWQRAKRERVAAAQGRSLMTYSEAGKRGGRACAIAKRAKKEAEPWTSA